jgi:hypothetical protein
MSFSAPRLLGNVAQYADRSLTFGLIVAVLAFLASGWQWVAIDAQRRRVVWMGMVWLVMGFGLTVFLPVRSSLYALYPSVGAALVCAAFIDAIVSSSTPRAVTRIAAMLVILPMLLLPVYRARNARLRNEAMLSTNVLRLVKRYAADTPSLSKVIVVDHGSGRPSARDAFGDLLPVAIQMVTGTQVTADIVSSLDSNVVREPGTLIIDVDGVNAEFDVSLDTVQADAHSGD